MPSIFVAGICSGFAIDAAISGHWNAAAFQIALASVNGVFAYFFLTR
jgi:hypothetical protein